MRLKIFQLVQRSEVLVAGLPLQPPSLVLVLDFDQVFELLLKIIFLDSGLLHMSLALANGMLELVDCSRVSGRPLLHLPTPIKSVT